MSFDVPADAYQRFMGRFSLPLADRFLDFAAPPEALTRVLDVGCGPGALTGRLVDRYGASSVTAVDPSAPFLEEVTARFPDVEVERASAERLPFPEGRFDAALAQLVVHFMAHPVAGLREMERVTRPDGVVAACVWDHAGGTGPLATFWRAARDIDPATTAERDLPGTREGHLEELLVAAGVREVRSGRLEVTVRFASFDEWWEPYTLGVGPAGAYVAGLDESRRTALRRRCAELLPEAEFDVTAAAWAAAGAV